VTFRKNCFYRISWRRYCDIKILGMLCLLLEDSGYNFWCKAASKRILQA